MLIDVLLVPSVVILPSSAIRSSRGQLRRLRLYTRMRPPQSGFVQVGIAEVICARVSHNLSGFLPNNALTGSNPPWTKERRLIA